MKLLLTIMLLALASVPGATTGQETVREVSRIEGDVYRFRNNGHYSVFAITSAGVVVTDPINEEAAQWLKAEIAKLTDQPITHLVYSHSDADHASGGSSFGAGLDVFAHEQAPKAIDGVRITHRFSERMQFNLGDHSFELTYLGPGHGTDLAALVIRPENVGFMVDAVAARRLPYRDFPRANADEWINQVRNVNALDFDILAGGHGPLGTRQDAVNGLVYLEELRAAVLEGIKAGKSDDQIAQDVTMDDYRDWINYDQWRELNVRGMTRHLRETGPTE